MTEFIGSRISLISKRDIRYVGTLHQISSEDATVALENVRSFGTEGRRPGEEVPANPAVYEYIVFKGSDVKDLRIEEKPQEPEPPQPSMPDDPAILGSQRRPTPGSNAPQPAVSPMQNEQRNQQSGPQPPFHPQGPNQRSPYQQMPYPPYGFPPQQHFGGHQGFPPGNGRGGPGFPNMPYGAPPPWYGPGGFGPPPHMGPGQFPHQPMPIGPPGQRGPPHPGQQPPPPQQQQTPVGAPIGPSASEEKQTATAQHNENKAPTDTKPAPSKTSTPKAQTGSQGPAPPTDTKPGVEAALAPPAPIQGQLDGQSSAAPAKPTKVFPAIPLTGPTTNFGVPNGGNQQASLAAQGAAVGAAQTMAAKLGAGPPVVPAASKPSTDDANRDARAAVAEAMAKLAGGKKTETGAVDNLTKQVANLRTTAPNGAPQNGRRTSQSRGGRGGRSREPTRKVEVPKEAFDFEASNAKFNKQDLVKEAIASGSPLQSSVDGASPPPVSAVDGAQYNKTSSFFDNISSEMKERAEPAGEQQFGGREFRNEERRKNVETFGQGSVDSGFRYGGRGRGRGRARARGRGRGGYRGQGAVGAEG